MRWRVNWRLKAILPVLVVLVNGLLVFVLVTLSLGRTGPIPGAAWSPWPGR